MGAVRAVGSMEMTVLAIDPGYEQSAWLLFNGRVLDYGIDTNDDVLKVFGRVAYDVAVLEQIESFGMAVGREVFETVFWTGRFFETAREYCVPERMPRRTVKTHICQSARAQDSNIRVALIDRFGGTERAIGKKKTPGPLYGIKSHLWAALAIAVTWTDQHREGETSRHAAIV